MAKAFPDAQVYAVDLSQEALALARSQNVPGVNAPHFIQADVLDTDALCSILSASLLQESPDSSLSFDLVISNPPYVRDLEKAQMQENVLLYEPHLALFVPDDDPLRFYRKIASVFSQWGTDSSLCALEINEEFAEEVKKLFGKNAYQVCSERDFRGKDRFVFAKKK
jgi:release factor glutamine methyltransferase